MPASAYGLVTSPIVTDDVQPNALVPSDREHVARLIVAEAECTITQAYAFIGAVQQWVAWCREHPGQHYYIPQDDLDEYHDIFAIIIPDGSTLAVNPGPAQVALQNLVLDASAGELGLIHDQHERGEVGEVLYCTVDVSMTVVHI